MEPNYKEVSQKWTEDLKQNAYAHAEEIHSAADILRLPRVWQKIFKHLAPDIVHKNERSAFEAGCGGGKHLVMLAAQGWHTAGIDVSEDVLKRGREYVEAAEKLLGRSLSVEYIAGDFFEYKPERTFDIVFHFGVVEHFLDDAARLAFLRNMAAITSSGGYVVSVVPSGYHPLRAKVRHEKLGGYNIPEIDYAPTLMERELRDIGLEEVQVLPNNLFGYLPIDNGSVPSRFIKKIIFYAWQLIPETFLPRRFALRHAYALIGIGRKKR